MSFNKDAKNTQQGKNNFFTWIAASERMKLDPCLTPYRKTNSGWIKDLNIKGKTIKLFEERGTKLCIIGFGDSFLNVTSKAQAAKEKTNLMMKI